MHSPTEVPRPYSGSYSTVELGFTPEKPLSSDELSHESANYPTTLAEIHVWLNGIDAAKPVLSGYLLWILDDLLTGLPELLDGGACSAKWYSDPWRFDLQGFPASNQLAITLHMPNRLAAIQDACVPLDQFCHEVIRLSHKWEDYLDGLYHDEMVDPVKGAQYRIFRQYLEQAEVAIREFDSDV